MRRLLDAVLFDLDGVLTSTTALHIDCWKRTFDPLLAELGQAAVRRAARVRRPRRRQAPRRRRARLPALARASSSPRRRSSTPSATQAGARRAGARRATASRRSRARCAGCASCAHAGVRTAVVSSSANARAGAPRRRASTTCSTLPSTAARSRASACAASRRPTASSRPRAASACRPARRRGRGRARRRRRRPRRWLRARDRRGPQRRPRTSCAPPAPTSSSTTSGSSSMTARHAAARERLLRRLVERTVARSSSGASSPTPAALESVFAVGNGYLGVRGAPEEGRPAYDAGVVLNGFHETGRSSIPRTPTASPAPARRSSTPTDGTIVRLFVDDEPFDLATARVLRFERVLDMRAGVLRREVEFETRARRAGCSCARAGSPRSRDRHLAAIDYEVEALDGAAARRDLLRAASPTSRGGGRRRPAPRQGLRRAGRSTRWRPRTRRHRARAARSRRRNSGLELACGMDHVVDGARRVDVETTRRRRRRAASSCSPSSRRAAAAPAQVRRLPLGGRAPRRATSSRAPTARSTARRRDGYDAVELAHARARRGRSGRAATCEVDGAPEIQQAVRFNLFQLMQATARGEGLGVPAKGVTGRGYEGHYFWDTEIYVVPFLIHTSPEWARQVLRVPLRDARRRAPAGARGRPRAARCSRGARSTARRPRPGTRPAPRSTTSTPTSPTRMHHYNRVTGDLGFLLEQRRRGARRDGALLDGARLLLRAPRRAVLHQRASPGPDEYTTVVDNNAYTNLMAKENLEVAVARHRVARGRRPAARTPRSSRATGLTRRRGRGLAPRGRADVRAAPRGARHRAPGRALPRAQALGLRGHAAREATRCCCTTTRSSSTATR